MLRTGVLGLRTAAAGRRCPLPASGAREKRNGVCLERQRLDKWLWHARVVKARSSAAALIEAGHVRVNGVREKAPGHSVRILKVVGFAERRGDATAARVLYDDLQRGTE
jgi:ribosome-associated heat shock protein Hsp15